MIKRRFILLILLAIGVLSSGSLVSLFVYLDPYAYPSLGLSLLGICALTAVSSILSVGIYFIKKVYYRGDVGMYHILSSLRQAFFFSLLCLGIIVMFALGLPILVPGLLCLVSIVFLELFIQSF